MAKIEIVLADRDKIYLEHMARYFMEKAKQCEIATFSSKQSLLQFLSSHGPIDILLIEPGLICEELETFPIAAKIILTVAEEEYADYECVKKYQKTEDLLQEILLKYAKITGKLDAIKGKKRTKTVAFYSPIGGSGKTTLALYTAAACVAAGYQTFYLNLERVDSTTSILGKTNGTMSDVFLSLKTKGSDTGIRILESRGEEPYTKFHYICAPDSISEYSEVTKEEFEYLIKALVELNEYDVLILDFSSEFHQEKVDLLENCDVIFAPIQVDEFSIQRMKMLYHENTLHKKYNSLLSKIQLIDNKEDVSGVNPLLLRSGLLDECPLAAVITMSPAYMNQSNLLRSAEFQRQMFEPLVACIQGGNHG